MSSEKQKTYPFMNVNAFTTELYRGNPATVVFLEEFLSEETLGNIAKNFNQSVTAFVVKSTDGEADYDISWYTQIGSAMALCGHGTLAAAKAIYVTGRVNGEIDEVRYRIPNGAIVKVRKEGERLEIEFPQAEVVALSGEDHERIAGIVAKAMGRERVEVKYVGSGVAPFDKWLMVELAEEEDLRGSKMDGRVFRETGFESNIVTTSSSTGTEEYIARMFAPELGLDEDQVCGSGNCLVGPHWAMKKGVTEMRVWFASERGGSLIVSCDDGAVTLKGSTTVTASGMVYV